MQQPVLFWDKIADKYARKPIDDMDAYDRTIERTVSYLHPTDRVLELGCGTGTTALRLADAVGEIVATDLSPNMLRIGAAKAEQGGTTNVRFRSADAAGPAPDDGPYDAVLAFNLLHLIRDPSAALGGIRDLVKPGGVFISKTPCAPGPGAPLRYRLLRILLPVMQALGRAPFVNVAGPQDWDAAIVGAGFQIVETGNYPERPLSHFIVARRG